MPKAKVERVEADVIGNIKDWCKARAVRVVRLSMRPGVETGLPDLVICVPGAPFWLETKKPGEKPDPKQEHVIGELRALGYDVDWCDNSSYAIYMIGERLARAV